MGKIQLKDNSTNSNYPQKNSLNDPIILKDQSLVNPNNYRDCDAGYIDDCSGDGDCCPESWIGDGFADCEDQAYGCDLTCYDNDGGDCAPACPDGQVECWDGSCVDDAAECPDVAVARSAKSVASPVDPMVI